LIKSSIFSIFFATLPLTNRLLTRRERANNVGKRDYLTKYGKKFREVLEVLLDKYAHEGIETIESLDVLNVVPFTEIGSRTEIVKGHFRRTGQIHPRR